MKKSTHLVFQSNPDSRTKTEVQIFCLKIIYPSYSNFILSSLKGTAIWELFLKSDQIWLILTNQLRKNLKNEILQNFTDQRQKQIKVTNSWKFQFKIKWRNMWRNQLAVCRFSVTNQWVLVHGGPCASWLPSENGKIYGPHLTISVRNIC